MNQSFLLHIDNDTCMDISFEEIMFMTAIKANRLRQYCEEIFVVQISLSDTVIDRPEKIRIIVKVQAYNGEFSGYSYGNKWESAITNAFESITQQLRCRHFLPAHQNTN